MKASLPSARVAVITRTKDRPLFLRRAMESVLSQGCADWVHVIVNDGGDPAPIEVLARFFGDRYSGRLVLVQHAESQGMQNASNAGLAASESEFVVIHDDDDSWHPDFLSKTIEAIEEGEDGRDVQGAVSQTIRVFEEVMHGERIHELSRSHYYYFPFANLNEMRRRNLFAPIAFLYRRAVHEKVGLFRQEFDVLGDHDFNLRFLRHFDIAVLEDYLAYYHWRNHAQANTVTGGVEKHRKMLHRMKNAYLREHLDGEPHAVGDLDAIPFPPVPPPPGIDYKHRAVDTPSPEAYPNPFTGRGFDVLSLDVFDTALRRVCHLPTDVFRFTEERWNAASGQSLPWAMARRCGEELARERKGCEVTLEEIFDTCRELLDLSADERSRLLDLELSIESEMLYADTTIRALAERAIAEGKQLIYLSDMYLSAEQIGGLLAQAGFPEAPVHVSSERGVSKHEGALFPLIAKELGVDPDRIAHIGDNFHSDFVQGRAHSWRALHLSAKSFAAPWCDEVEPLLEFPSDDWSRFLIGLMRRTRIEEDTQAPASLLHRLGFELAGPLHAAYAQWLVRTAKAEGRKRLILLGRDGYYLEKALKALEARAPLGVEFTYLHASRKVLNFASFRTVDETALEFLTTPHPRLKVRDFITRLGLDAEDYLKLITRCGFEDPDEIVTSEEGGQFVVDEAEARLRELFLSIRTDLEALFAADREAYQTVLSNLNFDIATDAIVDLGWAASSAKALSRFLETTAANPLHAYFLGTREEAKSEDGDYVLKSYYMHLGAPAANKRLLAESINWIEALFGAPFPTLLALRTNDGLAEPQFSTAADTGFSPEAQAEIWGGAEAFLQALPETMPGLDDERAGWAYVTLTLKRVLCEPSPSELEAWGGLQHSDGFGLEMHRPIIIPADGGMGPEELLEAFDGSTWKRGFLATLTRSQSDFVLQRRTALPPKTYEALQKDLEWQSLSRDKAWAEANAAKAHIQRLEAQAENQAKEWTANQNEIRRLQGILKELGKTESDARETLAGTRKELSEAEQRAKRAEELASELESCRSELAKRETAAGELAQKVGKLESDLKRAQEQTSDCERKLTEADALATKSDETLTATRQLADRTAEQLEATRHELATAHAALSAQEAESAQQVETITELEARIAELEAALVPLETGPWAAFKDARRRARERRDPS